MSALKHASIIILLFWQVHKADIERYTGEDRPPHIEIMITAASNKTTPPDLIVEARLKGVQKSNIIKFEKEAQNVVECVCQVFYRKEALNHWRVRVAFFPKHQLQLQVISYVTTKNDSVPIIFFLLPLIFCCKHYYVSIESK